MASQGSPDTLQLKLISCKDLKCFNFFQKLSFCAVATLGSGDKTGPRHQQQRTPADLTGGANPEWNHSVQFNLSDIPVADRADLFVEFDLLAEAAVFGDRLAGRVCVPVSELFSGPGAGSVQYVMYQVRSPEGRPNGILSFSYKVNTWPEPQKIESFSPQESLNADSFEKVESFSSGIYPKIEAFSPERPPVAAEAALGLGYNPPPPLAPPPMPEPYIYPPPPAQPVGYYPPPAPAYYPCPEPPLGYPSPALVGPYYAGHEGYGLVYGYPTVADRDTWRMAYGCNGNTFGKGLYPAVG